MLGLANVECVINAHADSVDLHLMLQQPTWSSPLDSNCSNLSFAEMSESDVQIVHVDKPHGLSHPRTEHKQSNASQRRCKTD